MENLVGKVALITGGTKGIGYGIAAAFLNQGMHVAITGRNGKTIRESLSELNNHGIEGSYAIGIEADVRDFESMQNAVKQIIEEFGKIDVVIANAGVGHFASIQTMSIKQWHETIDTNLTGAFYTLKVTVDELISSKGYYITISSLAGVNFFASGSAYNASKFGLNGFTHAVMLDLRDKGVKVSTIMPGSVSTYFNHNKPSEKGAWKIQIEDIGKLAVDLLKMHPRTLPSKIEVRPSIPPGK
ncbi:MAG: SDR family oxidoreductase [Bacteroidetes bacterium]|nr:MAG: SDR family oxidoreductase [Bacteroidota bacterium]